MIGLTCHQWCVTCMKSSQPGKLTWVFLCRFFSGSWSLIHGQTPLCCFGLSLVQTFATPWTVGHHALLFMEFSRQEYWSVLPFAPPGIFLTRGWTHTPCISYQLCHLESPEHLHGWCYITQSPAPTENKLISCSPRIQENRNTYPIWVSEWVKSLNRVRLFETPMDCSLQGSSVHGIFQARILEWVAISFSRGSSQPRDRTRVFHIVGRCFTIWATREAPYPVWLCPNLKKDLWF